MLFELSVEERTVFGRTASKKLRRNGMVPGIIYGVGGNNVPVLINHVELAKNMRHQSFYASLITLVMNGKKQTALLKDYQLHPFKSEIYHIDFQRVNEDKALVISVPIEFINAETCGGVKIDGGIVNYVMTSLEIQCLPKYLPNKLVVDLQELRASRSILVSDVSLPENVLATCLTKGEDLPIATIVASGADETNTATTAAAAEPSASSKSSAKK
ncbi:MULTISPECIES: 50S ribosomal protein L25/general stress protein Ctc [Candidatus Ichthyocystis]|uniref:Large ribosomal subunit protein bL25 n=1 Tax=Candidatus Ichthyocystis hellenicum TaxID=1561003 RepID=A0A0S4M1E2_9BURK|nr:MULTISPECIES: 50S ribosomal protein L25/general stress protein Ctc [Ichthyocystis]CUT17056.1 50S ribosomal protein L25 [Candidatus Ichthyocystis hellenicum]